MGDVVDFTERAHQMIAAPPHADAGLKSGGGGGTFDGMEEHAAKLEASVASLDKRFDGLDRRLDRIEDKIPSEWAIAKVVFFVVGALMAAAIFGPRVVAMLQSGPP